MSGRPGKWKYPLSLSIAALLAFASVVSADEPPVPEKSWQPVSAEAIIADPSALEPFDDGTPRGPGTYFAGFESGEGYATGNIAGQLGWVTTVGSGTTWATVSTITPFTGLRSLRIVDNTSLANGTEIIALTPVLPPPAAGPSVFECDIRISGNNGADYDIVLQSVAEGFITTRIKFFFGDTADPDTTPGELVFLDNATGGGLAFVATGVEYTVGQYRHLRVELIPSANQIRYFYNNVLVYTGQMLNGAGTRIDQVGIISDNWQNLNENTHIDNITVNPLTVTGACCANNTLPCQENVPIANCSGPNDRFVPFSTCAAAVFNPACGSTTPGDLCTNALTLSGQGATANFTTSDALTGGPDVSCVPNGPGTLHHDRWFDYTVPTLVPSATNGGDLVISTLGSDHDTVVVVYGPVTGTAAQICQDITLGNVGEVGCDDDIRGENLLSFLSVASVQQGQRYRIRVGTPFDSVSGNGVINVDFVPYFNGVNYLDAGRCCSEDGSVCTIIGRTDCEALGRFWQAGTRYVEGASAAIQAQFPETFPIGCRTLPCPAIGGACYNAISLQNAIGGNEGTVARSITDKVFFKYNIGVGQTLVLDTCGSSFDTVIEVYAGFGDQSGLSNGDCQNLIKVNDDCSFGDPDGTSEGASQTASCYAAAGQFDSCLCISRDEVDQAGGTNGRVYIAVGAFNPFRADTNVAAIDPVLNPFSPAATLNLNATLIPQCFVCNVTNVVDGNPVTPIVENEPVCSDNTSNRTNDGCSLPGTPSFQLLAPPTPGNPIYVRGTAGVYVDSVHGHRPDNDWYELNFAGNVTAEFRLVAAEFPARFTVFRAGEVDPCQAEAASTLTTFVSCVDTEDLFTVDLCAGRYFVRVRAEAPNDVPCGAAYLFKVSVTAASPNTDCCKGDVDGSGVLDGEDVDLFVQYLTEGVVDAFGFGPCFGQKFCRADVNNDGSVNLNDVGPFVSALLSKAPCPPIPPCTDPDACQLPNQTNVVAADTEDFRSADNFTPRRSGQITSVCWWGAYIDITSTELPDCGPGGGDAFTIAIYNDASLCAGSLIATQSVTATKTATGSQIAGLWNEYRYQATLSNPVAVVRDQCYWIEIQNNVAGTGCLWVWEGSDSGDGICLADPDAAPYTCPDDYLGGDLAFCLNLKLGGFGCSDILDDGQCCYVSGNNTLCVQTDIDTCIVQYDGYSFDFDGVCGVDPCPAAPCTVTCQPGDIIENEFCGFDVNGGCFLDAVFPAVQELGALTCGQPKSVCGETYSDGAIRDTDWYRFSTSTLSKITVSLQATRYDGRAVLTRLDPNCDNLPILLDVQLFPNTCQEVQRSACLPAGQYLLIVLGSDTFTPHLCETRNRYRVTVGCETPCPSAPNDLCVNAIDVTANINGAPIPADNSDASTEAGDLAHSCHWSGTPTPAEFTIWYKFTAPANGRITASICGSTGSLLDSTLAIYSGACGALTEVACDDDGCGDAPPYYSRVSSTTLTPGQVYFLQMGNTGNTTPTNPGTFTLTLTSP